MDNGERGASLVEMALVLPLLLLVLFGVVEFGRFLSTQHGVSTAAREAARYAVPATQYTDCGGIKNAAVGLSGLGDVSPGDVTVTFEDPAGTVVADCDTADATHPDPSPSVIEDGDRVIVSVSRPFTGIVPLVDVAFPSTITATDHRTIYLSS